MDNLPTHFDLVWRQALGGGTEVLKPNIPAASALGVWSEYQRQAIAGELGPGVVVYLQAAGAHDRQTALAAEREDLAALVAGVRVYVYRRGVPLGECVAWTELKRRLGVGEDMEADRQRWLAWRDAQRTEARP